MRLRRIPGSEEAFLAHPVSVANPVENKGNWSKYFGNDNPIHVEFGTGKGRFITTLAAQNENINYIGIDRRPEVLLKATRKADETGHHNRNLALMLFNIANLEDVFAEEEIARIYINFCDPWPKKRHAKRRLTHYSFLRLYRKVLVREGEVHLKTDNEQLFEFSLNEFADEGWRLQNMTLNLHESPFAEQNVMTEYEMKFAGKGMKIYRLEAVNRVI